MRDYPQLARELVRALRGRRSQAQASRRLGYASNVVFDWEAGRRFPTAAGTLKMARRCGIDVRAALVRFFRSDVCPEQLDLASRAGVAWLLSHLRGNVQLGELAAASGCSRFALSRWLKGRTEPRLPDFLRVLDAGSLRLLDFLGELVDLERVPSLRAEWQQLRLSRELAYDAPWSHAVLRALELEAYRRLARHPPGLIARWLGIPPAEEERCLSLLLQSGQIRRTRNGYRVIETRTVDTRSDPVRSRELRAFFSRVAADRLVAGAEGDFSFNLFSVSAPDLERLRALQHAYFQELRSIVARSEPPEHIVLTNIQLLPLV
jgi:transcriptional regulator with XRE-family HTH domain